MKTSPINSLLLLAIWPTTVVVQAFASSSSHKTTTLLSPPKSFLQKHHHHHQLHHQHNQLHTTTTSLNLFGGTTKSVATAVTNLIPRGGGASIVADRVSSLTSTPNGSFNLALGVLAACTAVLKLSNKATSNNKSDESTVVKKDPNVQSLQRRFLMVFWLLRMADWLQVSCIVCWTECI